jgi:hypothetical protein
MDVNKADIELQIFEDNYMVNLKWYRGASRYNNGATLFGNKYRMRFIIARAKELAIKGHRIQTIS